MTDEKKTQFVRPFSVMNVSTAVINDITPVESKGDSSKTNYFASIGYKVGKDDWQNVDLLVDGSLKQLAKRVVDGETKLDEINPCCIEIHNLEFTAKENQSDAAKPFLNSRGILAGISNRVF
ncbi:hypothetical protein [Methylophaga nitratireducenticrescens]|uniref:hypothetical protein n=1 Tax=Methylophaga nitratireducenticrescens TaxID=754476 RepID=UPI000CDBE932|nr:hypothetical protein [Methylophaga nitratireducenticrescens]AUZ86183.1 hypothetical protein CDW43_16140 [Methylophaga nitratireducenticrescens]